MVNDEVALGLADGAEARGRTEAVATRGGGDSSVGAIDARGIGGGGGARSTVGALSRAAGGRGASRCDAR